MLTVTASYLLAKSISKSIGKSFQSNYSEATVDTKVLTPAQLCFFHVHKLQEISFLLCDAVLESIQLTPKTSLFTLAKHTCTSCTSTCSQDKHSTILLH